MDQVVPTDLINSKYVNKTMLVSGLYVDNDELTETQ